MLEYLHLKNVGPAPEMEMELASRLNLITGDNGLGKSFLLDVAWWALTRRWPHDLNPKLTSGYPARPTNPKEPATIGFRIEAKVNTVEYESTYVPRDEAWTGKSGRPLNPGLVIYAHADGGFSVWDPARNYWRRGVKGSADIQERLPGYVFSANDVWDGLEVEAEGKPTIVCNGLLRDWASWIKENGAPATLMAKVLKVLSPEAEPLIPGPFVRLSVNDARDIPSIKTAYSPAIPILHASAGIRRIVGLAYMLIWSWNEHEIARKQLGENRASQVTILVDEIESHLHPKWQRSILNSLLSITQEIHDLEQRIQIIAATHSPLILAAAEPLFDPAKDAWFDLDLLRESGIVQLEKREFIRRGTVGKWLTSQAFDLGSEGRSLEAEHAIDNAASLFDQQQHDLRIKKSDVEKAEMELRKYLPDIDSFWARWEALRDMLEGKS